MVIWIIIGLLMVAGAVALRLGYRHDRNRGSVEANWTRGVEGESAFVSAPMYQEGDA